MYDFVKKINREVVSKSTFGSFDLIDLKKKFPNFGLNEVDIEFELPDYDWVDDVENKFIESIIIGTESDNVDNTTEYELDTSLISAYKRVKDGNKIKLSLDLKIGEFINILTITSPYMNVHLKLSFNKLENLVKTPSTITNDEISINYNFKLVVFDAERLREIAQSPHKFVCSSYKRFEFNTENADKLIINKKIFNYSNLHSFFIRIDNEDKYTKMERNYCFKSKQNSSTITIIVKTSNNILIAGGIYGYNYTHDDLIIENNEIDFKKIPVPKPSIKVPEILFKPEQKRSSKFNCFKYLKSLFKNNKKIKLE